MSGDDKFDDFLVREAAVYNRPREVPRDEMWKAIQARRGHAGVAESNALGSRPSALGAGTSSTLPEPRAESREPRAAERPRVLAFPMARGWGLAAAAVLLLVAGIAIGRVLPSSKAPVTVADDAPVRVPPPPGTPPQEQQLAVTLPGSPQGATRLTPSPSLPAPERRIASLPQPRAEGREPRATSLPDETVVTREGAVPGAHLMLLQQHLASSEALLVAFRAEARDGRLDAQLSRWARDLLSSTRLLLDSPAGDDPRRRRVLEQLEVLLVQIVHLAPDAPAEDRDDVGRAIDEADVMTRLRSTAPAGVVSSGT